MCSERPDRERRRWARRWRPGWACRTATRTSSFGCPPDPPFTARRPRRERLALLLGQLATDGQWVLSGSAISWATPLEPAYDLIVFLRLDPAIRMERLRRRETARYGARIAQGGDMASRSEEFLRWAEAYDTAGLTQRSLVAHETWLAGQTAEVLRLNWLRASSDWSMP